MRLLSVANVHATGHMHGVLPAHVGMRVRFTMDMSSASGLVQEQKATIAGFLVQGAGKAEYETCMPGELFGPQVQPAGIWLQIGDFSRCPIFP